ncbi:MAG TPA: membrane dipeptidase [Terriglobales bacterium]|nr:membrane dipeptidase [Terriglobales bacterium]
MAKSPAAVHQSALIIDGHADTTGRLLDEDFDLANPPANDDGHFDFNKAKKGNVGAQFFSIWVDPVKHKGQYAHKAFAQIDAVLMQAEKHPSKVTMAYSSADILKIYKQKKLAALIGVEGGHAIENDIRILRDFYRLGARYMTLTWSNTNEWADSSGDINDEKVPHHNGLTQFGREIVREMNRLGMLVDISHVSDRAFYNTLTITRAPVIASHSSARALTDHSRNMTDDMLRAMKENGGVVMVNFYSTFIDDDFRKAYAAQAKERNAAMKEVRERLKETDTITQTVEYEKASKEWAAKIPRPPLKALIDHIDHIAKIAGIDHVGLGSDFDGVSSLPQEIDSAADLPKITAELMKRGYSAADMHKILGGNFMRVFRAAEAMSRQMKAEGEPMPLLPKKAVATKQ